MFIISIIKKYLSLGLGVLIIALLGYLYYTKSNLDIQLAQNKQQEQQIVTLTDANASLNYTVIELQQDRDKLESQIQEKIDFEKGLREQNEKLNKKLENIQDDGCWYKPVPCDVITELFPSRPNSCENKSHREETF